MDNLCRLRKEKEGIISVRGFQCVDYRGDSYTVILVVRWPRLWGVHMLFSLFRQLKLIRLLTLGFGLLLLCIVATVGTNLAANTLHQASTDRLVDHLYPARQSAHAIVRLVLTIDDEGAWYVLSHDPHQQAQLLQSYQQDVQALRVAVARSTALAD